MGKKVLCGYGLDVDAVSAWMMPREGGCCTDRTNMSRGVFGATVGLDRVLKLFDKYNIKATFFTPCHTLESFPAQLAKVRDAGHEIGMHGYTHEFVSDLSEEQERDILAKCIDVITKFTGKKPRGWTAPAWTPSAKTVEILEEAGILYDHSHMHHDCQPYWLPHKNTVTEINLKMKAADWMKPMTALQPSKIIEIPANWHLDDWPPLNVGQIVGQGFVDPDVVLKLWKRQFDFYYREYDSFIFPITCHPQVTGKAQVILMQEEMIEYINSHEGVQWVPLEEMARQFRDGELTGATVNGGVDL
ncbi:uncharacterized protein Z520_00597 [Fonsecaea multimorphosa CBS 102226]|uniref:NodB homology domain-containing protein n=1 Tax=Fonsecaea multimorphosa CBS 102226 TaxID=1442371 RepID=A0A0D2KKE7_9EURO|nr:uncharacterized protein Z520_00597 [Fonsecaea multimorphosa CBS 102226]KIY03905.1 hypothetical protein Z520_00597 [Fonsecaea multimorphosa CBS 102226]